MLKCVAAYEVGTAWDGLVLILRTCLSSTYPKNNDSLASCADSPSYIADLSMHLYCYVYVEDYVGTPPECSGLYTVSAITTSTIVLKSTTIMNPNFTERLSELNSAPI